MSAVQQLDQISAGREALKSGSGWFVFHSDAVAAGDKQAMTAIAEALGTESDRDGGALWPIAPRASSGTFSLTSEEARLHTDAQYHDRPEPAFLLFCVVPASCGGGANRLLRASDLSDGLGSTEMLTQADVASLRKEIWSWEVPAVFQTPSTQAISPPHAVLGGDETVRWRSDNLRPGNDEQSNTADRFREYIEGHPAVETVFLEAGDVLYCDNQRALHGRTAFQDQRRLLYRTRLW
ncbi:MAG: TauD/TfdA family dioxygenase [Actinomycetota bacterium]